MKPVKIHEAKTHFSKLVALAEGGEEIVVQRGNVPVAKIVPYPTDVISRKAGAFKGQITLAPDFDELPAGFEDLIG